MINFTKSLAAWVSASPPQEGNSTLRAELNWQKFSSCLEKSISPPSNKGKKEHTSSLDNPDYQRKVWTI